MPKNLNEAEIKHLGELEHEKASMLRCGSLGQEIQWLSRISSPHPCLGTSVRTVICASSRTIAKFNFRTKWVSSFHLHFGWEYHHAWHSSPSLWTQQRLEDGRIDAKHGSSSFFVWLGFSGGTKRSKKMGTFIWSSQHYQLSRTSQACQTTSSTSIRTKETFLNEQSSPLSHSEVLAAFIGSFSPHNHASTYP